MSFAVGVITGPAKACRLLTLDELPARAEWRCVVAPDHPARRDARALVAPCTDQGFGAERYVQKQRSCMCKATYWFRAAFHLFPRARFLVKAEDDTVVRYSALSAIFAREADAEMRWVGCMQWAIHDERARGAKGRYCFHADQARLVNTSSCRPRYTHGVVAPFATGAFDARSRAFVAFLLGCDAFANTSIGSCDGGAGYQAARCLFSASATVHMLHMNGALFSKYAGPSSAVLHPWKSGPPATKPRQWREAPLQRFVARVHREGSRLVTRWEERG